MIQAACIAVALREHHLMMEHAARADLEAAAGQADKVSDAEMAEGLASMFKADQEILIGPEDLALVLESLKAYGHSGPEKNVMAAKGVIEKIEQISRQD